VLRVNSRDVMTAPAPPPLPSPHTRIGVGGVLIREGRVLVNRAVYRTRFTLPSGYVEPGEGIEAALVREFEEETGVRVSVGPLVLIRHKVVTKTESDVYLAFVVEYQHGAPTARPPEIAEVREIPIEEAQAASWISELSRLAIRFAGEPALGWPRSDWPGGEVPGLISETYHPPRTRNVLGPPNEGGSA
jgi:8-oxo-dGTP diphosphatase